MMPSNWATHGRRSTRCSRERQGEAGSDPAIGHPLATAIPMGKRDRAGGELRDADHVDRGEMRDRRQVRLDGPPQGWTASRGQP